MSSHIISKPLHHPVDDCNVVFDAVSDSPSSFGIYKNEQATVDSSYQNTFDTKVNSHCKTIQQVGSFDNYDINYISEAFIGGSFDKFNDGQGIRCLDIREFCDNDILDLKLSTEKRKGKKIQKNGRKRPIPVVEMGDSTKDIFSNDDAEDKNHPDPSRKQSQMSTTLKWLTENYERAEGVCLPRCVLYSHYLDFCKRWNYTPAGAATFGKIIRQRFPKLTTRRLGTRGQSKYHYYGIGIKETSIYYHAVYTGKGLTRFSGTKVKTEGSSRKFSLSAKTGTLLPEFPSVESLIIPDDIDRDKVDTFLMMYRTHCQRILDTIISANFDEVQTFLLHFWQGMPEHLVELLSCDVITDVIGLCDSILYKVLLDVLIPTTIQDLPESLCLEMRSFIRKLPVWMSSCLEDTPKPIIKKKKQVLSTFMSSLKRQISFVQLAQTVRAVLSNAELVSGILTDISELDFVRICQQAGFADTTMDKDLFMSRAEYLAEFKSLLQKQSPIESITEWMDNVIDICVLQPSSVGSLQEAAASFLLQWTVFSSLTMRDLTLSNAQTFGSIHLLRLMLEEYIFLVIDTQNQHVKERDLQKTMKKYLKNSDENICMKAKIRTSKTQSLSPKSRKRKCDDDQAGNIQTASADITTEETDDIPSHHDNSHHDRNHVEYQNNPELSRLDNPSMTNTGPHKDVSYGYCTDMAPTYITPPIHPQATQLSSMKHNGPAFDHHYLSHISLPNSYHTEIGNVLHSPRITDGHSNGFSSSTLGGSAFNIAAPGGATPYWNGATSSYPETYSGYHCYGKYTNSYDHYGRSAALLRVNQDGYHGRSAFDTTRPVMPTFDSARSAFDPTRSYYAKTQDNFNGSFGNYMEFAHAPTPYTQYGRQDGVYATQDDLYQSNLAAFGHQFAKSLVSPFR